MIRLNDLAIDPKSLGDELVLVEIVPVNTWKDGQKTNEVSGYKYIVASKKHSLKKIGIKIDGEKLLEATDDLPNVEFKDLTITTYTSNNGSVQLSAKASGISLKSKSHSKPFSAQ